MAHTQGAGGSRRFPGFRQSVHASRSGGGAYSSWAYCHAHLRGQSTAPLSPAGVEEGRGHRDHLLHELPVRGALVVLVYGEPLLLRLGLLTLFG